MIRCLRALLIGTTFAMVLVVVVVAAASAAPPGASCANTSSAIMQYCENLPSASGQGTPPPGSPDAAPTLATAPPRPTVAAIDRLPAKERKRARKLLSLRAPVPVSSSISGHGSAWSLPLGMIIAMLAIAAAGATAAIVKQRRGRTG